MTARQPVQLNYETLHRIRLAAGGFPADMKINEFGRQLSKAIYDYQRWDSLRDIKPQKKRLKAIQKTVSKLAALLRDDEENGVLDWYSQWPAATKQDRGGHSADGRRVGHVGNIAAKTRTRHQGRERCIWQCTRMARNKIAGSV
jgi:hypothetical protein